MAKRWIDADQLIVDLKEWVENIKNIRDDGKCFLTEENVLSIIDEQPTAYDVEKVREQLEELRVNAFNDEVMIINDAIEIVERGGMDEV